MQSVSLWAEATWYRLGGSQQPSADTAAAAAAPADQPAEHAPSFASVDVDTDEKVLVSR